MIVRDHALLHQLLPIAAPLLVLGCAAQPSDGPAGEPLVTLGQFVPDAQVATSGLQPTLVFPTLNHTWRLVDVRSSVESPTRFEMQLDHPPTPDLITYPNPGDDSRPEHAFALAYIAAIRPDAKREVPRVRDVMTRGKLPCPDTCVRPNHYYASRVLCVSGGAQPCLDREYECPGADTPLPQCTLVSETGDPALETVAQESWANFAGFSESQLVIYLPGDVPRGSELAEELGQELVGLTAGYHLLGSNGFRKEKRALAEQCELAAAEMAAAALNQRHGSMLPVDAYSEVPCAPASCPERAGDALQREFEEERMRIAQELACPPSRLAVTLLDDAPNGEVRIRVSPQARPVEF